MGKAVNACMNSCGTVFPCCPGLRSKSKVPGKRYKKLLADIFPKSPDASPNDRKIGKLAEYAARNPMRVPKIANSLEVRGVKELRSERYGYVTIVMRTYSKLLSSCQDQMPLFATSALSMIQTLLRHRKEEMQILACETFVDFVRYQKDSAYIHQCDHLLPAMVALAHETGPEDRRNPLRAAGLAGIGEMLWFMASVTHISPGFKEIVTAILDNVAPPSALVDDDDDDGGHSPGPVNRAVAAVKDAYEKMKDKNRGVHAPHGEKDPGDNAQFCVQNLARLAKEVTTARMVLDPAFQYFDTGKHWASEEGLAYKVLRTMQKTMNRDKGHQRSALLLTALTRHLDTLTKPDSKASILRIFVRLINKSKARVEELTLVREIGEITRHLRTSYEASGALSDQEGAAEATQEALRKELGFQATAKEALEALVKKVTDVSTILELKASILEKLTSPPSVARSTVQAMLSLARIVADVSGPLKESFPESLLTQLLQIMMFPDAETRVLVHQVLITLLPTVPIYGRGRGGLLKAPSGLPRKEGDGGKRKEKEREDKDAKRKGKIEEEVEPASGRSSEDGATPPLQPTGSGRPSIGILHSLSTLGKHKSQEIRDVSAHGTHPERDRRRSHSRDGEMHLARFSGHQACLLLSSLWLQSLLPDNEPANFEAMAYTFSAVVSFTLPKTKNHSPMIQAVRLAFSLRALSLSSPADESVSPFQARSLFTLSTAMLAAAAKAYGFSHIIPSVLSAYDKLRDERCPWLDLSDNERLVVSPLLPLDVPGAPRPPPYGSPEDRAVFSRVWPPNPALHPEFDTELAVLAGKIAATAGFLELEGAELEARLGEPFVPDDHYALRQREFSARVVTPSSPLNSSLLRAESLGEDDVMLSPAKPQDESTGALLRSSSAVSVPRASDVPSVEALLKQAEDVAAGISVPIVANGTAHSADGVTSAAGAPANPLDLLQRLGLLGLATQTSPVKQTPSTNPKQAASPVINSDGQHGPETVMQNGVEVPVTRSVKELRRSFAGPETGATGPVGQQGEESLFVGLPKEPWEILSLPPTSAYDQLSRAGTPAS